MQNTQKKILSRLSLFTPSVSCSPNHLHYPRLYASHHVKLTGFGNVRLTEYEGQKKNWLPVMLTEFELGCPSRERQDGRGQMMRAAPNWLGHVCVFPETMVGPRVVKFHAPKVVQEQKPRGPVLFQGRWGREQQPRVSGWERGPLAPMIQLQWTAWVQKLWYREEWFQGR